MALAFLPIEPYYGGYSDIGKNQQPIRDLVPDGDGPYLKAGSKHHYHAKATVTQMAEDKQRKTSVPEFVNQVRTETGKVVWPTRQETLQTTIAVLFMVILVAIMLWLFDMFLGWSISKLLA